MTAPMPAMNLAVIVLLRNEADIFPAFAQHLAALFDTALFMDHGSTDGTRAMLQAACHARDHWHVWDIAIPSFHQSLFTTFALRHLFANTSADAVFLLDADEFIDVADRQSLLDAILRPLPARCVPSLAWRTAVPHPLSGERLQFGDAMLMAPEPSRYTKVIVTRDLYDATGGALRPHAGNHVIDPKDGVALGSATIGTILHVPLRSLDQMARKTIIAALSHLARTDRPAHEGAHRFDALSRIAKGSLTEADLLGWAAAYGEDNAAATPRSEATLRQLGFIDRTLNVAHTEAANIPMVPPQGLAATLAGALLNWQPRASADLRLVLDGTVLRDEGCAAAAAPDADWPRLLTAAEAERDVARAEVAALRGSTLWRAMAPLRWVVGAIRR